MNNFKSINLQIYIMLIAIVVIMAFFSFATDGAYLSARNISNLLRQTSITGILAIGMVFVIISAEIDLSVGSMMGLLGGFAITNVWWAGIISPVCHPNIGLIIGGWNGWWVAYQSSIIYRYSCRYACFPWRVNWLNKRYNCFNQQDMTFIGQGYLSGHHWNGIGYYRNVLLHCLGELPTPRLDKT